MEYGDELPTTPTLQYSVTPVPLYSIPDSSPFRLVFSLSLPYL